MGTAVWEFMWLIDKITKIDDEGLGWVLGGKPIQLKDIEGIHRVNVSKNLTKLEKEKYIFITHTPYGMIIKVLKAKKRFSKIAKPEENRGLAKTLNPVSDNAKPLNEIAKPNKTVHIDNTIDNIVASASADADIPKIINMFQSVSPNSYKKWFENITERKAAAELLTKMPFKKLETLIIQIMPQLNVLSYVGKDSKAFKPSELLRNLDKIITKIKELQIKRSGLNKKIEIV